MTRRRNALPLLLIAAVLTGLRRGRSEAQPPPPLPEVPVAPATADRPRPGLPRRPDRRARPCHRRPTARYEGALDGPGDPPQQPAGRRPPAPSRRPAEGRLRRLLGRDRSGSQLSTPAPAPSSPLRR